MSDTITITDLAEVREGDWVFANYNGHRFEGEAWESSGHVWLGTDVIRYADGSTPGEPRFVEAQRPKPTLPTARSLIRATVRGERVVLFGPDFDDEWLVIDESRAGRWVDPVKIDVEDFEVLWTEGES